MTDNTTLNPGSSGDTIRDLDRGVQSDRRCDKFETPDGRKTFAAADEEAPKPAENQENDQQNQAPQGPDQEPSAAAEPEQQAPAPASSAPPQPNPEVQALADSVAKIADAVKDLATKKSARKKRTITTKRDEHGNLIASVEDAPEDNE